MKKRALAVILAVIMLVSALPSAVFADNNATLEKDSEGYYLVKTYDEFCDFLRAKQGSQNYLEFRLMADIVENDSLNDRDLFMNSCRASFDLNGHTLSRTCKSTDRALFYLINDSSLVVYDSSLLGTGRLEFANTALGSANVIRANRSRVTIENGNFKVKSSGAVLLSEGSEITIVDGVFEDDYGSSYGIQVRRTVYGSPAPTVLIYNAVFRTSLDVIDVYQSPTSTFTPSFPDVPIIAVLNGEFYTDHKCGLCYIANRIGECFVYGGLIPKQTLGQMPDYTFANGTTQTPVLVDDKDYYYVSRPMWLSGEKIGLDRFSDAVMRDYLSVLKEKNASDYKKYKADIDSFLASPARAEVSERYLDPVQFKVSVTRSDVKSMRLYSCEPTNEANWNDGPWTLEASLTPVPGDVYLTVDRPKKMTTRFYRLDVVYNDGTTWTDYAALEFEEPRLTLSGTPYPTMNAVRYGNTLFCGITDYPSEIPVESLKFEWFIDGKSISTERKITLDDSSWVGKELTVRVTSTAADGSIVSAPVKIAKGTNGAIPAMPNVKVNMNGTDLEKLTVYSAVSSQEYLISKKKQEALTEDDWKNSIRANNPGLSMDPDFISSQFGFEPKNGDTIYVHTRFYATEALLTGSQVVTTSVYIGEKVYLNSITFPDAINGTVYLAYNGSAQTYDIPYSLDPVNADSGGDIRWRVNSPLTLESPSAPVSVKDSDGHITVRATGVGTATVTAYYQTSTQTDYGRVTVVVYDPNNVGADLLKPAEPLQDVTIYAGNGYSAPLPTFMIEPSAAPTYSWYFTRGTMYGFEKITSTEFASIDPSTGEIETSAPGKVTVSLFADNNHIDSYELTVINKPDDHIALEELFTEPSAITLNVGEKRTINVLKSPANASAENFTFTSSDPYVAEVNGEGVITAHSEGKTEITVSAPSEGVSVKIKVTVKGLGVVSIIPGDANGDGELTARDVVLVMRAALPGFKTPEEFVFAAADMDANGEITARDVIDVMKAVLAAL